MIKKLKFLLLLLICFHQLAAEGPNQRKWQFPKDEGVHPNYKNEWWYITGHFTDKKGNEHGLQVTFFRNQVPTLKTNNDLDQADLYSVHVAWSHIDKETFFHDENHARPGLAYVKASSKNLDLNIKNWQLKKIDDHYHVDIPAKFGHIKGILKSSQKMIFHGKNGLSYKSPDKKHFSYYYSLPKLEGELEIQTKDEIIQSQDVSLWMDREIFNRLLDEKQQGWDWFALQLDDGSALMCFQVRSEKNIKKAGTFVSPEGITYSLNKDEINFKVKKYWKSPTSDILYPIEWEISIPKLALDLDVVAAMKNQELKIKRPIPMHYWEGKCKVTGTKTGKAYMELVGYQEKN